MNIGVFFGSKSTEHDVSIITGTFLCNALIASGYKVVPVYVGKDQNWYIGEELKNIEFFQNKLKSNKLKSYGNYKINITKSNGKLVLEKSGIFNKSTVEIDVAFPAFHGTNGEDGTFQGLCEFFNVPYIGCEVLQSAIAMDKVTTKLIYQRFNFPTTKFIYFTLEDWLSDYNNILEEISANLIFPVFVKPSRLGSSIGIAKCNSIEEVKFSIEAALQYDQKVLVEEGIENVIDLTVCVKGTSMSPVASEIQQSNYSQDFFSYEDKYIKDGGAQTGRSKKNIIIPAKIDFDIYNEIKNVAIQVYKKMELSGIARIDFLLDATYQKFYVNEINTLPGTFYHHLWEKSNFKFTSVLRELIDIAIAKHKTKNSLIYNFNSNILSKGVLNKNISIEGIENKTQTESTEKNEEQENNQAS